MPRQPKHSAEYMYDTLKHLRFIDPDGHLLPWADNVWATAVEAMNGSMTKEHLWLYIKKDRYGVSSKIHGINQMDNKDNTLGTSIDDSRDDLNWSMEEAACPFPSLRTKISISKKEWDAVKTHIAQYKEREYEVLVIGWADAVYEIIWNHLKLPCPFSFKSYINRNPGEIFLKIRGSCRECSSKINIYCTEEPKSEDTDLHISTFDTRGVVHQKKRQIRGDKRLRIGKELQGTSTYTWRREKAREQMSFGDVVPAHIPTEEVLRKTKQEVRDKELGVFKAKSALATLWDWKHTIYKDVIYEIGLDKFYLMYWSPTQTHMFKKFLREDCAASISIDATGSLVKQIQNPDNSKRVIYLYQAVCGYQGKILPIFQLLSEKHDTNTLTYWMREWLRSGGLCPKQVVVDYSMALLNAVKITNTCAFDCTAQSMLAAMSDYASYFEYLRESDNKIFKLVETLSTASSISSKIYEVRGAILLTTKKVENGILDGFTNIAYLQEKFLLHEVPSLSRSITCNDCQFTNIKTLPVLHVNPLPIQKLGMRGLQEALSLTCRVRSTETCFRCKSAAITKELSVGPHIMINIEDVGNPLLAERNGYPYCRKQFTITEIPEKVVFADYEYGLVSAIVYAGGHYVAFIKRVAGKWEEHDDLKLKLNA